MNYISVYFIAFLTVFFAAYFLTPKKFRWIVLLAASVFFYLYSQISLAVYIVVTIVTVFFGAVILGKINASLKVSLEKKSEEQMPRDDLKALKKKLTKKVQNQKRIVAASVIIINFGILAVMKYSGLFTGFADLILKRFDSARELQPLNIILPLGISFYTFQSIGYLIDVYRGKYPPDKNIARFALFVSFFPQIIQGPINRYDQLAHQLYEGHPFDETRFKMGAQRIMWGFFKKLVIADRAAVFVSTFNADPHSYTGFIAAVSVVMFMIQVYADFSGGMDISLGIAQCVGIEMTENFQRPHFAASIGEYWRRWHITLGAWMKDYLLYPITFSVPFVKFNRFARKKLGLYFGKLLPPCIAMGVVFFAVGIWHGSQWKYVMFGIYNSVLVMFEIIVIPFIISLNEKFKIVNTKTLSWKLFLILNTMFLVFIGKYFAMAPTFSSAVEYIKMTVADFNVLGLFNGSLYKMGLDVNNFNLLIVSVLLLFCVSLAQERGIRIREVFNRQNLVFRWIVYIIAVFSIIIFGVYGRNANAAGFFYGGF